MKKRIIITEGNLRRIVRKCINEAINENWNSDYDDLEFEDYYYPEAQMVFATTEDIENGRYDDKLQEIIDKCCQNYFSKEYTTIKATIGISPDDEVMKSVQNRLSVLDRN